MNNNYSEKALVNWEALERMDILPANINLDDYEFMEDPQFENTNLKGADFRDALIIGVSFRGANLTGADFSGATLLGRVNFSETFLDNTNFPGIYIYGMPVFNDCVVPGNRVTITAESACVVEVKGVNRHFVSGDMIFLNPSPLKEVSRWGRHPAETM